VSRPNQDLKRSDAVHALTRLSPDPQAASGEDDDQGEPAGPVADLVVLVLAIAGALILIAATIGIVALVRSAR
jgi:hypothetical protein